MNKRQLTIDVNEDGTLEIPTDVRTLLEATPERRAEIAAARQEAYDRGVAETERLMAEKEAAITGKPDWEQAVLREIDNAVERGMDREQAERMVLNSPIFKPWKFKDEGPTILDPLKTKIKGLPTSELYRDNLEILPYRRPSSLAAFASKEYSEKRLAAAKVLETTPTDKEAKKVFEGDPLEKQYQAIYDEAIANMYYWRYWFERALDVLTWKQAERAGKKTKPPKWVLEAIQSDEEAMQAWRASLMPKGTPEQEGMFAVEPEHPRKQWTVNFQRQWTTPAGASITNPYEYWQGLDRAGRAEEMEATKSIKDKEDRESLVRFFEFLNQKYPLKSIVEGWEEEELRNFE